MSLIPETSDVEAYLAVSDVIDWENPAVRETAERLSAGKDLRGLASKEDDEVEIIRAIYHFVRDEIAHSADIGGQVVTCKASEVLEHREGICYAKAHLLAALLRCVGIPTGFCYQRLLLDDEEMPWLIVHGLNAVYLKSAGRWIRLDARGNKAGVEAEFSLEGEKLAFPVRPELGESEDLVIYADPSEKAVQALQRYQTVEELLANLPTDV
ncbi:ABC transporter ATP-binding protein [Heliobacterium undosum]|uniref:ABC transporter ATP-binding protein n=1 Tax=Heliomicrobium undosum TaxID=121734 RepID=A0A845L3H6_9FIRM|nr:ABC transporter ATP-binding protein [Heliomicrobium undosum]